MIAHSYHLDLQVFIVLSLSSLHELKNILDIFSENKMSTYYLLSFEPHPISFPLTFMLQVQRASEKLRRKFFDMKP